MIIIDITKSIKWGSLWTNMITEIEKHTPYLEPMSFNKAVDNELLKWNAHNEDYTPYIEFDSEQDVIAFILRWS